MITVNFHAAQVRGLPLITVDEKGQRRAMSEIVILKPGRNEVSEEVLESYKRQPEIKKLLLRGPMGGLEVVAQDGQHLEHEAFLAALYEEEKVPSLASRAQEVAMEMQAALEASRVAPPTEEILSLDMPISTPENS